MTFQKAEFIANRTNLESLLGFIEQQLQLLPLTRQERHKLLIASEEITVNIINFAYPNTFGKIWIEIALLEDKFSLSFQDEGQPFNPMLHQESDLTLSADEREPGGLGIVLVKQLVEQVTYEYKDGKNRLTLIKSLQAAHTGFNTGTSKVSQ